MRRPPFLPVLAAFLLLAGAIAPAWANTTTPNKGYNEPAVNGDQNIWGTLLNQNASALDKNLGGNTSVAVTGGTVTAAASDAQNMAQTLTGTLTSNLIYQLPATGSFYIINNQTSGGFSVTIITTAVSSTGVIIPQGQSQFLWSDGTNVYPISTSGIPIGTILAYGSTTPPSGYLLDDGSCKSTATYAALYTVIGDTWTTLDSCSAGTFGLPDPRGRVIAGYDAGNATGRLTASTSQGASAAAIGNAGGEQAHTLITAEIPAITPTATSSSTSTVTDPGHTHTISNVPGAGGATLAGTPGGNVPNVPGTMTTNLSYTGITVATTTTTTISPFGSGDAHNVVQPTEVLAYIIKY